MSKDQNITAQKAFGAGRSRGTSGVSPCSCEVLGTNTIALVG